MITVYFISITGVFIICHNKTINIINIILLPVLNISLLPPIIVYNYTCQSELFMQTFRQKYKWNLESKGSQYVDYA